MLTEKAGKIQKKETDEQTISINGKEVSLLNYKQICIEGKNGKTNLYKDENLTEKIKSIFYNLCLNFTHVLIFFAETFSDYG